MSNGQVRLTVPRYNPINAYTMGAIAADAGFSPEEFKDLLRGDRHGHQISLGTLMRSGYAGDLWSKLKSLQTGHEIYPGIHAGHFQIVWRIVHNDVPKLFAEVRAIMAEDASPPAGHRPLEQRSSLVTKDELLRSLSWLKTVG